MSYPFPKPTASLSSSFNPFKTTFKNYVIDGKETVSLLEAPAITRKPQWKLRSFMHCEKKIRPKLNAYPATTLISVFGRHFDVNTHVAIEQADSYVLEFDKTFANLENLTPLGYYNHAGMEITGEVRNTKRPPNLAFVLVEANIKMNILHKAFDNDEYTMQYYLKLPQSYSTNIVSRVPVTPTSPPILRTPQFTPNARIYMGGAPMSPSLSMVENIHDTWDLDDLQFSSPKMSKLMQGHKTADKTRVYSYHGPLSMFDNQIIFDSVFSRPHDFFKVSSQSANTSYMFERDRDNADLNKMRKSVMFEVFVHDFRKHYVGDDTPELRRHILSFTTSAITSI